MMHYMIARPWKSPGRRLILLGLQVPRCRLLAHPAGCAPECAQCSNCLDLVWLLSVSVGPLTVAGLRRRSPLLHVRMALLAFWSTWMACWQRPCLGRAPTQ